MKRMKWPALALAALLLTACAAAAAGGETEPAYPFPTEVEGYTFVSFRDNERVPAAGERAGSMLCSVVWEYFEQVYPDCSRDRLTDFVLTWEEDHLINLEFAARAGYSPDEYWFDTIRFYHPLMPYASFDVLVSRKYGCAFFGDAPFMAETLAAWDSKSVGYEEALAIAGQAFSEALAEQDCAFQNQPVNIRGDFAVIFSEHGLKLWEIEFTEAQTPYDRGNHAGLVFLAQIDADTGELRYTQWTPDTVRQAFLKLAYSHRGEGGKENLLYYNPDGGVYYHLDPNCPSVAGHLLPLRSFSYAQAEDPAFRALRPCKKCCAPEWE